MRSSVLLPELDNPAVAEQRGVQAAVWRAMRLAGVEMDTPGAKEIVWAPTWFIKQQPKILHRFDPSHNDTHTREGFEADDYWPRKLGMYLHRVGVLTLESPQGRQAVAEYAATAMGLLASVWRVAGPPASVEEDWRDKAAVLADSIKYD